MKKILGCMIAFCLVISMFGVSLAEESDGSKFESFLLKKGTLISKVFTDIEKIPTKYDGSSYPMTLQLAVLTDIQSGEIYKALRLEFTVLSGRSFDTATIVFDADEVEGAIAAFGFMQERISDNSMKEYTEYVYTTSGGDTFCLMYSDGETSFLVDVGSGYMMYDVNGIALLTDSLKKASIQLAP